MNSIHCVAPNQTLHILYMSMPQGKLTVSAATNKSLDISWNILPFIVAP